MKFFDYLIRETCADDPLVMELYMSPPDKCPGCGGGVVRVRGEYGMMNQCSSWPKCDFRSTDHGIMADSETRRMRVLAHGAFDKLWKPINTEVPNARREAYKWLARKLGSDGVHFGTSDASTCRKALALVKRTPPTMFAAEIKKHVGNKGSRVAAYKAIDEIVVKVKRLGVSDSKKKVYRWLFKKMNMRMTGLGKLTAKQLDSVVEFCRGVDGIDLRAEIDKTSVKRRSKHPFALTTASA